MVDFKRKNNRLKGFSYSNIYSYYITICTKNNKCLLGRIHTESLDPMTKNTKVIPTTIIEKPSFSIVSKSVILSKIGEKVEETLQFYMLNEKNKYTIDHYIIMPNHVHLIITLYDKMPESDMESGTLSATNGVIAESDVESGTLSATIKVQTIIQKIKSYVSKSLGYSIWQKSFYDHIIRNEKEYYNCATYIVNNPLNWDKDELFSSE
ncbi:MAG: hypothetical protein FWG20_01680 [Candidatus Cloacimonetes bacterium]|nr:hypothetical protein [Candidatus Cloacimonadota bacterium]